MIDPADFKLELQEIGAESIGWIPLGEGVYVHLPEHGTHPDVITVVDIPDIAHEHMSVVLLV
jgi:hypothetical protein